MFLGRAGHLHRGGALGHDAFRAQRTYIEVPLTIERTIFLADASLLWILLVQSKSLGITWKSSVAEIAIGFVLYLTVQATTRFVVSIYQGPLLRSTSSEVGQLLT